MIRKMMTGASFGCALLLSTPSFGQLSVSTPESLVNLTTASTQQNPAVAQDTAGRYVVVWESENQDADGFGIYAQIYNADHTVRVSEFQINTNNQTGDQRYPDVAMDVDGNFTVVWQSNENEATQGWDVYRKVYDIDGNVLVARSRINSTTAKNQQRVTVAMNENYIVAAYMSQFGSDAYSVRARFYDAAGTALAAPYDVMTAPGDHLAHVDVAMDDAGNAIFVWQADNVDGDRNGIFASGFDFNGTQTFSETQVNTTTAGNQQEPAVAVDSAGNAMVVWSSFEQDNSHYGVYSRLMNTSGSFSGSEVRVNSTASDSQDHPSVAASRQGSRFVVTWTDETAAGDGDWGVMARQYEAGSFQGSDSLINVTTSGRQMHSDIAYGSDDYEAIIVWQGGNRKSTSSGDDTDEFGVYVAAAATTDVTPPNAVCQNITVYLDGSGNATITGADVDGGSTDNVGIVSYSLNNSSFTCADAGSNVVILTVADAAGNSAACAAVVTVVDSVTPTAVCQDITVYLDGTGSASITAADIDNGSTDNCSVTGLSLSQASFTCADAGSNSVILSVTDPSGNIGTCTATVTVVDSMTPTAVCQDLTVYLDASGNAVITGADLDNGSSDNCSGSLTYTPSVSSFDCTNLGANAVTLTVTDPGGNSSACSSTVTVLDTVTPTIVCQNITVYLDGSGNASITAADVDGGSTDNCGVPSLGIDVSAFTCANVGANTVTLTGTDGSGNVGSCTAIVTVVDSVTPTAVCQDITVYLDGAGIASITESDIDGGSSDNCGTPTLSASQSSFTCADVGANTVTLTVTDGSGNSAACTATVTVIDSTAPTAVCQNLTVYLDATGNATITAGDVDAGSTDNCALAGLSVSPAVFTCANVGANTVTLTVTDVNGNSDACTATVTVVDSVTPTAVCQNITVYLDGSGNATITAADVDGGSTDNCGSPALSIDVASFTCANIGANTVNLTATDGSGNVSSCVATVTVVDSIAPTAVCQNITVYLDGAGNATITAGDIDGGSSDNCGTPTLSASQSSFTCSDVGANTVTLTATDAAGNVSTCTSTVTVVDSTAPIVACQNLTVYLDAAGNASISTGDVDAGSSDNCGIASYALSSSSFDCTTLGANFVTLTVTDVNGNIGTCTSTVTVVDSTAPTVVCQNITVYLDGSGNAVITATDVDGGSSDNCGTPSLGIDISTFTCSDIGANTVILTATDAYGNVSSCSATVTVADTTSPTAITLSDLTDECSVTATAPTTTDNCAGTITGTTTDPLTYSSQGSYVITWTFDDGNGNVTTATQNVLVDDVTAPVTPTLADLTDECSVTATAPVTTDNCAGTVTGTTTDPLVYNTQGTYTITWIFDDGDGNTTSATQNVIISDVTLPTASNIDTAYAECIGDVAIDVNLVDDEADNCTAAPIVTYVGDVASNGTGCGDTITRTYNVADEAGNNIDVTQIIILNDVTPPTASNPVTLNVVCLADVPSITGSTAWVIDEADNCGTPTVAWISDVSSNGTGCNDTITRTFSVTDDCGNMITVEQLIIINDHVAPTPDLATLEYIKETCEATPTAPTATDNCAGAVAGVPDVSFPITTVGTTIVTWTFTDNCGNVTTQTQEVIITGVDVSTTMASDGITMVASNQNAGVTYQWIDCETGTPVAGATAFNFTPTYGSDFAVIVTENGCSDTSACVNSTVGLGELVIDGFILYPNPTTGQFTVGFDGEIRSIEMIDVTGRVVMTETTLNEGLVDASLLAPGKYLVRLTSENGTILTQPIVIGQQ